VPQSVVLSASGMLNGVRTLAFIGQTEAMSEHHPLLMTAIGAASHELKKDPKCKLLNICSQMLLSCMITTSNAAATCTTSAGTRALLHIMVLLLQ
jgi:hypothetical protein